MGDQIYSNDVLALAADIPHATPLAEADGRARRRSTVCGSEVEVGVTLDAEGRIAAIGLDVRACALGQAAASVLARGAIGASLPEIETARDALAAMLTGDGPPPKGRFGALAALAPVRDYPQRHASTLLAFRAAADAVAEGLALRSDP